MKYKSITRKKFFKTIRENPRKALKILKHRPELATLTWKGKSKWIPGSTPLHWAAHDGNLKLVKALVKHGADINAAEADWWCRPIDWAADAGRYRVVRYLLEQGADAGGDKWSNCTSLHVVAQGGSGNGKERTIDYGKTAMVLINAGLDVNAVAKYGGQPPAVTPLDEAKQVGNHMVAQMLRASGGLRSSEL